MLYFRHYYLSKIKTDCCDDLCFLVRFLFFVLLEIHFVWEGTVIHIIPYPPPGFSVHWNGFCATSRQNVSETPIKIGLALERWKKLFQQSESENISENPEVFKET